MGRTGTQGANAVHKKLKFGDFVLGLEDQVGEDTSKASRDVVACAKRVDAVNSGCKTSKRSKGHFVCNGANLGAAANGRGEEIIDIIKPKSVDPGTLKSGSQLRKSASFGNSRGLAAFGVASSGGGGYDLGGLILGKEGEIQNVNGTTDLVTDAHATSQVLASLGLGMKGLFDDEVTGATLFRDVLDPTEARLDNDVVCGVATTRGADGVPTGVDAGRSSRSIGRVFDGWCWSPGHV
ncbi:hypothetical protein LIER_14920 [Lithospermum erythrorhizon]|uniref:Uncharacterized protein n=1 Tax=Lithospermum erythrorhizon TaxID=34254 RepID=A0AAV3Q5H2_LITER